MSGASYRLREQVAAERARYVAGTPERYPKATARVIILDAEKVLSELDEAHGEITRQETEIVRLETEVARLETEVHDL